MGNSVSSKKGARVWDMLDIVREEDAQSGALAEYKQIHLKVQGKGYVGKTTLIQVAMGMPKTASCATVYDHYVMKVKVSGDARVKVLIYDLAGQDAIRETIDSIDMPAHNIYICVAALDKEDSFDTVTDRITEIRTAYDDRTKKESYVTPMVVVICNKKDLPDLVAQSFINQFYQKWRKILSDIPLVGGRIVVYRTSCIENETEVKETLIDILTDFYKVSSGQTSKMSSNSMANKQLL